MRPRTRGLLLAAGLAAAAAGCGNLTAGKQKAEQAVEAFHQRFNEARFDAIYDAAGPEFQKATSREDWGKLMEAIHRKLGKAKASQGQNWNLRSHNLQTFVHLVQLTTFESGTGTETFAFAIRGDEAVLLGYNINSTDLILQ